MDAGVVDLIGAAVATFFTGSPFKLNEMMQVTWMTPWRGLDALFVPTNYFLAFAVFFLARTLGCLFFINTINHAGIHLRCIKQLRWNAALFVVTGRGSVVNRQRRLQVGGRGIE